ncbi:MAG: helix-turn-helix domain-containing protein [Rhodospirillales bacterium]|jgi:DNA-binding transcriptional ArsR family regulator
MSKLAEALKESSERSFASKWGHAVFQQGFTMIPNALLQAHELLQSEEEELKLSPTEFLVVFQLISMWWKADVWPFPSKALLARRTGISPRQVQRVLSSLKKKKLIRQTERPVRQGSLKATPAYSLTLLVDHVNDLAARSAKNAGRMVPKEKRPQVET